MARRLLGRLGHLLLVLWAVTSLTFVLFRLMPGDPTLNFLSPSFSEETRAALLRGFGLDRPIPEQYVIYMGNLLRGELGMSFLQGKPVAVLLADALPNTVVLTVVSLVLAYAVGIVAGLRSGRVYASLGPQLEFMAVGPGGAETPMGGTAARDDLRLRVALDGVRYPAQLILLKNGWFHAAVAVEPGAPAQFEFADRPTAPGYYRLELYAVPPGETRPRRETTALLLLSNPIYVA